MTPERREHDTQRREEDKAKDEVIKEIVHTNPVMRPARRIQVSILFLLVCIALAVSYFLLQDKFNNEAISACHRANDVREESNTRIQSHVQDENNLLALLNITTQTRGVELATWIDLNNLIKKATPRKAQKNPTFKRYEHDITSLIHAYQNAHDTDLAISANESTVRFDQLPIVNCAKIISGHS